MTEKFIKKYMRFARQISLDQTICLSRGIGTVIVNPKENRILGTGYNGPPRGTPHCDSHEYLEKVVYSQLTETDKGYITGRMLVTESRNPGAMKQHLSSAKSFADYYSGCGACPRKLVGAESGQRLDMCSCCHSEQNAIINAGQSVFGSYLFCWCGPPCFDICAKAIVNAGISRVYSLKKNDSVYNEDKTRWLFKNAGVELFELPEEWINEKV